MRSNKKNYLILLAAILLAPGCILAAEATSKSAATGGYNMLQITLVSLMLILLYFIGMLANTLRVLSEVLKEKFKNDRKANSGVIKTIAGFLLAILPALHALAAEPAVAQATPSPKSIEGIPINDYYAMIGFIIFELLIIFALSIYIKILSKVIKGKYEQEAQQAKIRKKSWFWDDFNAAVPIEKEKDLLLDHNYDGIQELDNSLPPWWKYGFYLTILVGFIYVYRFHVSGDGLSQQEEYAAEMQQGEEDKAAYLAQSANNVDESSVTLLTDGASVGEGKDLFIKNCVACHLADGGGSVGPNLTDEYWLHGGSIQNVFKTIKYGWQDKGMKSWKDDFSPKQIQELASFVKSLKGTKPAVPKAPQGELFIEASAPGAAADTTKQPNTDSTSSKKEVKK